MMMMVMVMMMMMMITNGGGSDEQRASGPKTGRARGETDERADWWAHKLILQIDLAQRQHAWWRTGLLNVRASSAWNDMA